MTSVTHGYDEDSDKGKNTKVMGGLPSQLVSCSYYVTIAQLATMSSQARW